MLLLTSPQTVLYWYCDADADADTDTDTMDDQSIQYTDQLSSTIRAQKEEAEGVVQPSSSHTQAGIASDKAQNSSKNVNSEHWIAAMKEELDQIQKSETWELVPRPKDKNVIGMKWVFRNKLNEG
ncbi:retrovirus-related Pol polyprotein from transposon TNT 1-94 isoform X2 [Cryptomeria japonica]|uniref:retrovirus-related Pol polyprotein from transposon TNT 1-94 isoform X2 n=1 Tax=Cryptomeria japonica TaxID=3369 RepID=UPI0027D9D997|nr:retrovirus-related Pol polyprotein from transposon TNT 1-94 isoform X2 [Cryptomeria japonica]